MAVHRDEASNQKTVFAADARVDPNDDGAKIWEVFCDRGRHAPRRLRPRDHPTNFFYILLSLNRPELPFSTFSSALSQNTCKNARCRVRTNFDCSPPV